MSTDDLLRAVARAAREDEIEGDPRWDALVEGKISAEDRAALEELAGSSRAQGEAWQALQPLDDEARSRMTDRILAQLQGEQQAEQPPREQTAEQQPREQTAEPQAEQPGARVIPFPARRRWGIALAAVGCAAAIALLVLTRRDAPSEFALGPQGDPQADSREGSLPAYEIALVGGERAVRADPGATDTAQAIVLGPGSALEITLRPATAVRGPLEVRGFLVRGDQVQRWDVRADVSEEGAVRIAGEREALFPKGLEGTWEISVAVGRPGTLPDGAAVLRASEARDAPWRLFRRRVQLTAE